ncbi:hypothetical protein STAN_5860 [Streptomyces sp. CBMAI 2042]|nr:hypothetical protein STAN_5860 [Streptomyces sp. CBMAI 2042]
MKGQMTRMTYNAIGTTKNPTMNRYLPCCIVTDSDLPRAAAAGDA